MEEHVKSPGKEPNRLALWAKRLGVVGFAFFLIKGLMWLMLPAMLIWFGTSC